jgi:glucokinase
MKFIVADIGGTNTRLAGANNFSSLKNIQKFPTEKNYLQGINKLKQEIKKLSGNKKIQGLVLGLPGIIDSSQKTLTQAPNLKNWTRKPLTMSLSKTFNCPVFLKNDTDLAGLGEAIKGAGKNKKIVAYLSLGTGVGGTRIVNQKIDQNTQGFEPGHQIIKMDGQWWPSCKQKGCLESYVSGKAFFQKYKIKPENCHQQKIWQKYVKELTPGLINLTVLWSPQIIIIGGGIAQQGQNLIKMIKQNLKQDLKIFKPPLVVQAQLGDQSGLYGGLLFLKNQIKS